MKSDHGTWPTRSSIRAIRPPAARDRAARAQPQRVAALIRSSSTLVSFSLYGVVPSPVDELGLGRLRALSGLPGAWDPGRQESTLVMHDRELKARLPAPVRSARRRHRHQRRRLDRARGEQPSGGFDRRKCKAVTGPRKADGSECSEVAGRSIRPPDRSSKARTSRPTSTITTGWTSTTSSAWGRTSPSQPDQIPILSLVLDHRRRSGRPCACRTRSASIRAAWTVASTIRTADGRVARVYANYGTHFVWHIEGGKGTKGKLVKFQIRPDPLAN